MYPRVSIHIVAWNSMEVLPDLLASIKKQSFKDFAVLVIDNASTDGVEKFIREHYPEVTYLRNVRNLGFTAAHNQGIRYAMSHWNPEDLHGRYVLVTNPDTIWNEDYLEKVVQAGDDHPNVGVVGGKLLRAFGENVADEVLKETVCSDVIDSTGFKARRTRNVCERGAGEMDKGQYNTQEEVFGITGALAMYRAEALQDVAFEQEYFDHQFFAYKEDVDLAWRLQWKGWKALYVPTAKAYHYRGMYGGEKMGWKERIKNRLTQSPTLRFYSTRNHCHLLLKNLAVTDIVFGWPFILFSEVRRFLYTCLFEPKNLRAYIAATTGAFLMLKKRRAIMRSRTQKAKELRGWFK